MFNKLLKKRKLELEEQNKMIENSIREAERKLASINSQIEENLRKQTENQNKLIESQNKLDECLKELGEVEGVIEAVDLGMEYTPKMNNYDEICRRENAICLEIGKMLDFGDIMHTNVTYKVNGSEAKGRKFQETFCKNLIMSFNTYFNAKKKTATYANWGKQRQLVTKKFESLNSKGRLLDVYIDSRYLFLNLELLDLTVMRKEAERKEKERIKEERKRLREQEKLLAEAEKEKKKLEEEKKAMELAYGKSLSEDERNEIKEQLAQIDKRLSDINYRVQNPKAGWLYIIHSPSLKNMIKIGVTRRLSGPYERVKELSGSSLPEAFQIDAYCFSDDAFALESAMHEYFKKNRINPNKEFFSVSAEMAIDVLKEEFGCEVHFVDEEMEEEE